LWEVQLKTIDELRKERTSNSTLKGQLQSEGQERAMEGSLYIRKMAK
jgi:hypothetical protein